jgi:hypothetical protein
MGAPEGPREAARHLLLSPDAFRRRVPFPPPPDQCSNRSGLLRETADPERDGARRRSGIEDSQTGNGDAGNTCTGTSELCVTDTPASSGRRYFRSTYFESAALRSPLSGSLRLRTAAHQATSRYSWQLGEPGAEQPTLPPLPPILTDGEQLCALIRAQAIERARPYTEIVRLAINFVITPPGLVDRTP